ncbi:MAG: hypothetical protein JXB29_08720 [Sedimentisphaerales bacterium]|nr:hypothetical protein [Sedimentisphaerales bacterium]
MKVAVPSDGPNMDANVAHRLSAAEYLLIIDVESGEFEALPESINLHQRGSGVRTIVTAVSKGANAILTGYCGPSIVSQLESSGVEILTGITGTVRGALDQYRAMADNVALRGNQRRSAPDMTFQNTIIHTIKSSLRQFFTLLPVLLGVVLLIGLLDTFISKELLLSIFSGNVAFDSLWGTCLGSVFAGNPINSYIIGGELLKYGISLFAVTAFIVSWVTVGLVQLPAEIAAFGKKFALLRNGMCFVMAIPVAILTGLIVNFLGRWIT